MPDSQPDRDRLASLPALPRDEGGPVFAEPWQAQAFALAVRLSAQGYGRSLSTYATRQTRESGERIQLAGRC